MTSDLPVGFALLMLLATGYVFVLGDPVLARRVARYNGQRIYLTVAVFGILLFCLCYTVVVLFDYLLALVPDNKLFTYNHDPNRSFLIPVCFFAFFLARYRPWPEIFNQQKKGSVS